MSAGCRAFLLGDRPYLTANGLIIPVWMLSLMPELW
jgi:hypothetical protein